MRIAFLCKRRYMAKDVIADRYGRLYEIPYQLARLGHEVQGYCLSYQGHQSGAWTHTTDDMPGQLNWESQSLRDNVRMLQYPRSLLHKLRRFNPDIVIAASDMPHIILGAWLTRRLGCRLVADLYDDFESFGQARIPGLKPLFRRSLRQAHLIVTTSDRLATHVLNTCKPRGSMITMPSSVDTRLFAPMDQATCRRQLGLPEDGDLIGTAGDLKASRGINVVYQAWGQLASTNPNCHLVLAGPIDKECPPPTHDRVHYLGELDHRDIPVLFNALDVGVIYLVNDPFGWHCYPQKVQEMMACELPMVAADVGAMPDLMVDTKHALYRAGDAAELARAAQSQLQSRETINGAIKTWEESVWALEVMLQKAASG